MISSNNRYRYFDRVMWKMIVIAVSFLFGKKVHEFRYVPEFLRRVDWKKTRHEP